MNELASPRRRVRWERVGLGAVLVIVLATAGGYWTLRTTPRSTASVVNDYIRDLNAASPDAVSQDIYHFKPSGDSPGSAAPADIVAGNRRPWRVAAIQINDGTTPQNATAFIRGTAGGNDLRAALPLFRKHGRWYVIVTSDNVTLKAP